MIPAVHTEVLLVFKSAAQLPQDLQATQRTEIKRILEESLVRMSAHWQSGPRKQ